MSTSKVKHETSVSSQAGPPGMSASLSSCTCGWYGPVRDTRNEAEVDAHAHAEIGDGPEAPAGSCYGCGLRPTFVDDEPEDHFDPFSGLLCTECREAQAYPERQPAPPSETRSDRHERVSWLSHPNGSFVCSGDAEFNRAALREVVAGWGEK